MRMHRPPARRARLGWLAATAACTLLQAVSEKLAVEQAV
jgi:hypothetical protein